MKKKHIFKKRNPSTPKCTKKLIYGTASYISLKKQRFDFVFIRVLKKKIRRRYCKVKMRFFKPRFWLFLKGNYICSAKSKNARMGAGVGQLVRVCMQFLSNFIFIEFRLYSINFLKKALNYLKFKCNIVVGLSYKYLY